MHNPENSNLKCKKNLRNRRKMRSQIIYFQKILMQSVKPQVKKLGKNVFYITKTLGIQGPFVLKKTQKTHQKIIE